MAVFVKGEATKTLVEKNLGEGKIPLPPLTEKPPTMVLVFKARSKKRQALQYILIFDWSVWRTRHGYMGGLDGWECWKFWGCLDFRVEMIYPKNTNVVTQNTSDEEEEAMSIIADAGSH